MKYPIVSRRLSSYSALAASFLAMHTESDAQIVYTNYFPDKLLVSTGVLDTLHLDLDGDATTDFIFNASHSYSSYASANNYDHITITGVNGDRIAFSFESSNIYTFSNALFMNVFGNFAKPIVVNTPIDATLNFINNVELYNIDCYPAMFSSVPDYCWTEGLPMNVIKYVGFRLKAGPIKYYGWMRLSVNNIPAIYPIPTAVTIYDYAINYTPNTPILAGQVSTCIPIDIYGVTSVAPHWAKVYWEPIPEVTYYEVAYRSLGGLWESKIVPPEKTNTKINGLSCSTDYEWQIRSLCPDGSFTEYSEAQLFTTDACRTAGDDLEDNETISIFSNSNRVYINFESQITETSNLFVYDMVGQLVGKTEIVNQDNIIELTVPTGMYTVNLVTPTGSISKIIAITQ